MLETRTYKGNILNQTCILVIENKPYWLMFDNSDEDYVLVGWKNGETKRLGQIGSPQVAKLSHFDNNLVSNYFGSVSKILIFKTGYYALCYLQHKSEVTYTTVEVDKPRVVTLADLKYVFGDNITLDLKI